MFLSGVSAATATTEKAKGSLEMSFRFREDTNGRCSVDGRVVFFRDSPFSEEAFGGVVLGTDGRLYDLELVPEGVEIAAYFSLQISDTGKHQSTFSITKQVIDNAGLTYEFFQALDSCKGVYPEAVRELRLAIIYAVFHVEEMASNDGVSVTLSEEDLHYIQSRYYPDFRPWIAELICEAGSLEDGLDDAISQHLTFSRLYSDRNLHGTQLWSATRATELFDEPNSAFTLVREVVSQLHGATDLECFRKCANSLKKFRYNRRAFQVLLDRFSPPPKEFQERLVSELQRNLECFSNILTKAESSLGTQIHPPALLGLVEDCCVASRDTWLRAFLVLESHEMSASLNCSTRELLLKCHRRASVLSNLAADFTDLRPSIRGKLERYRDSNERRLSTIHALLEGAAQDADSIIEKAIVAEEADTDTTAPMAVANYSSSRPNRSEM